MKIKLRTLLAGPRGCVHPGTVIDWPEVEAQALIQGGYAEAVEPAMVGAAPVETATAEPPEAAVTRRGRPTRHGP